MNKQILCLSGWGQKFDSLEFIFNEPSFDPFFVSSFDYLQFDNFDKFINNFQSQNINPEIVIGWSLGGQNALRLIEKEIISPKLLILIAPPFQMVKNEKIKAAMAKTTFEEFYNNFTKAPDKTLKQFAILSAMNDKNASQIARNLDICDKNFNQLKFWLEELKRFTCFDLNFNKTPKTLFFQGLGDMITHESQTQYFQKNIKNFQLETFKNCGHAPHLNNLERFRNIVLHEIV